MANWPATNSQQGRITSGAIAEVLGGQRLLRRPICSFAELAELIPEDLPAGSLISLGEKLLELKNAALSDKLAIPDVDAPPEPTLPGAQPLCSLFGVADHLNRRGIYPRQSNGTVGFGSG